MIKTFAKITCAAFGVAYIALTVGNVRAQTPAADNEFFESKVRPVLFDKCFACHGDKLQRGGVRLDSRAEVLKDASALKIVTPGNPDFSALIRAIRYESKVQMPPGGKLPQEAIDLLTQWVKRGAPWPNAPAAPAYTITAAQRSFWSFQPIRRPASPKVKNAAWVRSPIDAFILAGLEGKGLRPAPQADRRTLIRRATYDLTGLPPTPAEITVFLADKSPDAFAKVVDRLLASPRYGERWGRHWLDVARYADSTDARGVGSEGDISEAWRYRDWVVNAFNSDMGYDRFVMNQIAGDLLPPDNGPKSTLNVPGTIATGLLAIGNWGNGDADKEKLVTDIADDEVDIVSRGVMGVTVACARCHDHKFDPFPTTDYYGMAGIFFSSHILPRLTPKGQGEVMLRIPLETPESKAARAEYEKQLNIATTHVKLLKDRAFEDYAKLLQPQTAAYLTAATDFRLGAAGNAPLAEFAAGRHLNAASLQRWTAALHGGEYPLMSISAKQAAGLNGVYSWRGNADCPNMLINTTDKPITISTLTVPARSVAVHPGPSNGVAVEWVSPIRGVVQITGKVVDGDPNGGDGIAWAVDHQTALGVRELSSGDFPNGGAQDFMQGKDSKNLSAVPVSPGERLQLVVLPKANYGFDTTVVQWTIKQIDGSDSAQWDITREMMDDPVRANPRPDSYGHPGVWRFSDMADIHREDRLPGPSGALLAKFALAASMAKSHSDIEAAAASFQQAFRGDDPNSPFRPNGDDISMLPAAAQTEITQARAEVDRLTKAAPPPAGIANGIAEGGIPDCPTSGIHDIRVHIRGRYDRLGEMVPRHFPLVLGGDKQPPITSGSGRLELAHWLVSDTHPLTARVMANRIWQHHFGTGIVRTPSNFGMLGERPTNPALLDWLASCFKQKPQGASSASQYACGWSMKRLHRLIMLSSTYQQSSQGDVADEKSDPDNLLFGRYNRQRLEAEAIRDTLLAVAGDLDTSMGGVATRDFNSPRRTLYIMTIRSDRSGYAPLFDTADPTSSVDKRVVSTVAPQALFLMNNPFVTMQAKALAKRASAEGGATDAARIGYLYNLLYGRPAGQQELKIGESWLSRSRGLKTAATCTPDVGTTAWDEYCRILLCANELVYID